jgi:NTP pyrophosphatase (non-canonical NTP hydrolase)
MQSQILFNAINLLAEELHQQNVAAGWWHDPKTGVSLKTPDNLNVTLGWKFLLAHSELSEAIEGVRRNSQDDKLPHRKMVEVEIADTFIRLLDIAGAMGLDIGNAMKEKIEFNAKRADHKLENRNAEGGKAF